MYQPLIQPRKLITFNEVVELVGVSKMTVYRYLERGDFPPPIKLSARSVRWSVDAINKWIDEKESAQ